MNEISSSPAAEFKALKLLWREEMLSRESERIAHLQTDELSKSEYATLVAVLVSVLATERFRDALRPTSLVGGDWISVLQLMGLLAIAVMIVMDRRGAVLRRRQRESALKLELRGIELERKLAS